MTRFGVGRSGVCGMCGEAGQLTKTHIPPRCTGNSFAASQVVTIGGDLQTAQAGREREGGIWMRMLCGGCNSAAGLYDLEWARWQQSLLNQLLQEDLDARPQLGGVFLGQLRARPGSFARSSAAACCALMPKLRIDHPELVRAVIEGAVCEPPSGIYLLIELYAGKQALIANGGWRVDTKTGAEVWAGAEILWPGIHLVVTDERGRNNWPSAMLNVFDWLRDPPDVWRDVSLVLPVVDESTSFAPMIEDLSSANLVLGDRRRT